MNRRIVAGVTAGALIAFAQSFGIDLNDNGMSDVWENTYAVPSDAGAQEYDGDGFTNAQESLLGTDPRDRLSRANLEMIRDEAQDELRLRIDTVAGKYYHVEQSDDLTTWYLVDSWIEGEGAPIDVVTTLPDESVPAAFFWYRSEDVDEDYDGLTWWEELQLGTDDYEEDSDGDAIGDAEEFENGTDPSDYYNGIDPIISIAEGADQDGVPDFYTTSPIVIEVRNAQGLLLVNAPLDFTITQGEGILNADRDPFPDQVTTLTARTAANGRATVHFMPTGAIGSSYQSRLAQSADGMAAVMVAAPTRTELAAEPARAAPAVVQRPLVDQALIPMETKIATGNQTSMKPNWARSPRYSISSPRRRILGTLRLRIRQPTRFPGSSIRKTLRVHRKSGQA